LGLLHARVAEHQLDDADVDTVSQQSACAFVPEVVPAEIDPLEFALGGRTRTPENRRETTDRDGDGSGDGSNSVGLVVSTCDDTGNRVLTSS
jgi:hypothetical protein